jgi:tubulin polyglutamylase TTLL4
MSVDMDDEENEKDESFDSTTISTIKSISNKLTLLKSVYEGRPATVFFPYPPQCERTRDNKDVVAITEYEEKRYDLTFKIVGFPYKCVINNLQFAGFKETEDND